MLSVRMKKSVIDLNLTDLGKMQHMELLERVLASPLFERSARLREFLRYVGTKAIQDGATSIHEQQIGAAVFGRPDFYDTGQDNIVRVNATELRKRLDSYFASEGASEPIVISLPRGSYAPVFTERNGCLPPSEPELQTEPDLSAPSVPLASPRESESLTESSALPPHHSIRHRLTLLALTIALLAIGILGWNLYEAREQLNPWRNKPTLQAFWSNFLTPGTTTNIVLADTSFSVAQDLTHYKADLNDYLNFHYQQMAEGTYNQRGQHGAADALHLLFNRNSGSIGDFRTAQAILNLVPGSPALKLHSGRELSGNAIRHDSTILIGSNRSNAWVDLYKDKLDFTFDPAPTGGTDISVTNHQPEASAPSIYSTTGGNNHRGGYCIIAYLPNLSGEGQALIIAGTDAQATEAGGDFITHEPSMASLLKQSGHSSFPHFQLLLRTSRMADTPLSTTVVALHLMKN